MCANSLAGLGGPAFCGGVLTWWRWVWQAVGVETESISVGELLNDPANVRQHGARNLETIKASLARFGQQKPIVVDASGVVVAGNGTLAAARELGWQSVHVVRSALTGSDRTAYAIADNRTAELAEWDDAALAEQLSALAIDDAELLAAAGYDPGELEALADAVVGGGEVVEDEAPEPPADPVTQPGDLWQLGDHRVLCGDSTRAEDVARLMGGEKVDVVFTDPPYGANVQGGKQKSNIAGDLTQTAIPFSFELAVCSAAKDRARIYFCGGEANLYLYQRLFERYCRQLPRHLVWVKNGFVMKPNGYHNQYELIFHGFKPGGGGLSCWFAGRKESEASDVWQIKRDPSSSYLHPTQKPVELPARAIRNSCPQSGAVFDPFLGSGATLIAAEQLGRRCYGIEISPAYCDVIVERWENLTGGKAKRVADG